MITPEQAAQAQLDAYNARNIDAFAEVYADDVQLYSLGSDTPFCSGKEQLRERYGAMFAQCEQLNCRLISRIICGNTAIDEERVTGLTDGEVHAVAVYDVADGLIRRAWFVRG
ncbi:nuclear transport factor 2 family protein [Ignavibacteria bacterium]|jgi:hypothetical protein|nr:nuclear transport factor 2 family protein [Bacteroidota bacterium]MCZ2131962.1 nuclear transport factor 2 family protein [Bacteroidota bacterium]